MSAPDPATPRLAIDELIACPRCDALHRAELPHAGERAICRRCGTVLIAPRAGSYGRILMLATTIMILMFGAVFFPFLQLRVAGLRSDASVFDTARAFAGGNMAPLAVAVALLIVLIPVLRVLLISYVLAPLAAGRRPARHAAAAFRLSEDLRPWSMAEIFVIGTAVALVKLADLAQVVLGPAFWMFAALVVVTVLQDGFMCRWSIWRALEAER
ncbi:paraquat-inducible protein A [Roseitranquillus sediminis]|uniref:paraquat-inducible protein A n=1 Tax=Roseitranquillus sediminis TaxID=2809051 RepID=UPI001D0CCA2D|nr:paraquat-inducible protein A [Roseitranquillus sediminis]MBM9593446.1 paraquat-inducible protein A [Roseitranquillus sediminis]